MPLAGIIKKRWITYMKILGIDTTTKFLCLGLYDNNKLYSYRLEAQRNTSSFLGKTMKRVLEVLQWRISDIDYLACGLGPGSFTGIRVGLATIKGLAWSLNKPIAGISTLDILAKNAAPENPETIVPILDAKRGLIYCSAYKFKSGTLKRTLPYLLLSKDELFKKFKGNCIFLGDALGLYKDQILRNVKNAKTLDIEYWYPQPHNIINIALDKIKQKKLDNAFDIKPIYIYPKECQIRKYA